MFGEIDCREGLTMAVDKLKYETVEAAMDVLLTIYKGLSSGCLLFCFTKEKNMHLERPICPFMYSMHCQLP